ncbi:AsmA-like C-terminal domain-containing protein [Pseudemcibacter aquimaris]|uniref:YhdP family protein n=1 Tax=Pseudemcibacter aquimaris TaxID=2857064 RepID=UPI0020136355|nr:AsmA-like C-terminal domain-containing protein [Pseudemcibacter aquimaris]MCC3860913.1 AsmA-like C-terminal region-containing protein [Pseudemcibacter aquimaris]WDU59732.1 AsmA-like C-terminal region-containing protein [Pseudemcibacter aquimaris]
MVIKPLRYIVKTFLVVFALITIAMILFFWRVSNGPVELDGRSPFLSNLLISQNIGTNVSFESSILTWRGSDDNPTGSGSFEIRFLNINVEDESTSTVVTIPRAGMQFSMAAIFRGVIAPMFVEFSGIELNLLLPKEAWSGEPFDQDEFIETMRAFLDEFNNSPDLIPQLTRQILLPPDPLNSTGYLQQVYLANTTINLQDELSGDIWHIPDAALDIKRIEDGFSLMLDGTIDFEADNDIPLHMSVQYSIPYEKATSQLRFSNFIPTNIAGEVEGLADLATLDIPISGIVDLSIDKDFDLPVIDFEFDVGEGMINPLDLYDEPIKIDEAYLIGQFITLDDELSIEDLFLKFDGAELNAEGTIGQISNDPDVMIVADVASMPLINLKTYWPPGLLIGARTWIENNITGGIVPEGQIDVNIRPEMWAMDQMPDDAFIFDFKVLGGVSHFLKPMPQLTDMIGTARLQLNHFQLNIQSGVVENAMIRDAVLHFNDIAKKGESFAHFEIPVNGRVEDILHVIDYDPLGYPSLYGIRQGSILGRAEAFLTLDFPLIKGLKLKDVEFDVKADIEDLHIPELSEGLELSDGTMTLSVNRDGISSNGSILLNGIDFNAIWNEDFTKSSEYPTTYIVDGEIANDEWETLHLPFEPYVNGPAMANLILLGQGAGLKVGEGKINLTGTQIEFEPIGWVKEDGDDAETLFALNFEDEKIHVNDVVFHSENLNSELQLTYDGERASRLYIDDLTMEGHDFSALFDWDYENELYQVSVKGNEFNAVPIMDIILSPIDENEEETDLPDFNLSGAIGKVGMYNDIVVERATVLTGYVNNEVIDFAYDSHWGEDKDMSIIITSGEEIDDLDQKLTLSTNDAGNALRALDFFTSGDQGNLMIAADMIKMEKGYTLKGTIEASDFTVADSAAFSELLKEKEFARAQEELEENGLSFATFEGNFEQYDEIFRVSDGTAKGPTLGVTLDGYVDQKYDEISLKGTIIPAYGLNSLLSNIPLLGTILTGGKDEGIFAATYNMRGTIDDPEVNINPLMALAPGIFRKIFGALGGSDNEPTAREEAEEELLTRERIEQQEATDAAEGEVILPEENVVEEKEATQSEPPAIDNMGETPPILN